MDWDRVAASTLRALRGSRSQRAMARRLGYTGNVVGNWERAARFPTWGEFLVACARLGVDVGAALARFQPAAAPTERVEGDGAAARWLDQLRGDQGVAEVARRTGLSRHALRRWFGGDTRPRLPDALRLVDGLTGRVSDLIAELVPIDAVPELAEVHRRRLAARDLAAAEPWVGAVLRVVEVGGLGALDDAVPVVARRLGLDAATTRRCLTLLLDAGVIRAAEGGLHGVAPLSVAARPGAELATLKHHWALQGAARARAPRPGDLLSFNVCSLSRADLEELRARHRRYFAEVRALVAASRPPEVVALLNLQLVSFEDPPPPVDPPGTG